MTDGLTREFFDRTETDDTLQNIRKQYLASKKNLHDLMLKQSTLSNSHNPSPVRTQPPQVVPSEPPRASPNFHSNFQVPADDLIILNELRSLKTIVNEQQGQIKRLSHDLQTTRNLNFQLQDKVSHLQNHIGYLESDMMNFLGNARSFQSMTAPSSATTPSTTTYRSSTSYQTGMEDNTTRLIQMSGPK